MCAGAGSCCCKTSLGVTVPSPPSLPFCLGEEMVQLHLGYCETLAIPWKYHKIEGDIVYKRNTKESDGIPFSNIFLWFLVPKEAKIWGNVTVIMRNCTIQLDGVATCSCSTKLFAQRVLSHQKSTKHWHIYALAKYSFPCRDINSEMCHCLQEYWDVDVSFPSSRLEKSKRLIHESITCCVTQC